MNLFNRLPGSRRAPAGLEWKFLKRLPAILLTGTLLPAIIAVLIKLGVVDVDPKDALEATYTALGVVLFHWMSMLILAILCVIVTIMKGHAYVADAYPLPDSDSPKP